MSNKVECPEQISSLREMSRMGIMICNMFYVYIAKDRGNKLYTGITENLKKREVTHNTKQGALFTKSGNFKIVFTEEHDTLAEARKREIQIKKWRRKKKEILIDRFRKGLSTKM